MVLSWFGFVHSLKRNNNWRCKGLIGADLTQRYLTWHETSDKEKKQTIMLAVSVMIIMMMSFAPFIDIWAHFGKEDLKKKKEA